jgi:hypothetical protein
MSPNPVKYASEQLIFSRNPRRAGIAAVSLHALERLVEVDRLEARVAVGLAKPGTTRISAWG